MGKKKALNENMIPEYAIERFARCIFDDVRADFAREDVRAEFARWITEREQGNGGACRRTRGRSRFPT